jgi:hypothetical protein
LSVRRPATLHTVLKAVEHARHVLDDPHLTESKFRHWLCEGKMRYRRFGGVYAFRVATAACATCAPRLNEKP